MASGKEQEAAASKRDVPEAEAPPVYTETDPEAGSSSAAAAAAAKPPRAPEESAPGAGGKGIPTAASPFNFPTDAPLPSYSAAGPSSSSSKQQRPVAVPQAWPDKAAPFLEAWAPSLLARGIPEASWEAFLQTLSAFLTAKVSDQAISHAAEVGKKVGAVPLNLGKGITNHAKSIGRNISGQAKRGNIVGAAVSTLTATITLPVGAALNTVGAAVSLPFTATAALASKPKTPRQRADVYAAAANKDWFRARGMRAQVMDTAELAQLAGFAPELVTGLPQASKEEGAAAAQLAALREYIAELEVPPTARLYLGQKTLWLVLTEEPTTDESTGA